jgi:hypothetical protein
MTHISPLHLKRIESGSSDLCQRKWVRSWTKSSLWNNHRSHSLIPSETLNNRMEHSSMLTELAIWEDYWNRYYRYCVLFGESGRLQNCVCGESRFWDYRILQLKWMIGNCEMRHDCHFHQLGLHWQVSDVHTRRDQRPFHLYRRSVIWIHRIPIRRLSLP